MRSIDLTQQPAAATTPKAQPPKAKPGTEVT
jgi:hypothetical protein